MTDLSHDEAQNLPSASFREIASTGAGPALAFRFASRELRGGLRGFYIFLACIALGVAAIVGVNAVARSITEGIAIEGQSILGGDASFSILQRELPEAELGFISDKGQISEYAAMRAMARLPDGSDQTLIEFKAVDNTYPLFGELEGSAGTISASDLGENQAVVDEILLQRLNLEIGGEIEIGTSRFTISDIITLEPDRISEGLGFGPKVIVSRAALEATGLVQPGSLIRYTYNLKLDDPSAQNVKAVVETAQNDYTDTGWRVRSRENAAPALARNIERFSQFLTLVGLTALIVGGVGVANAIRAFLETKRPVIASFKSLGAPGNFVFQVYLFQILILATIGVIIGLVVGTLMPVLAKEALAGLLPVSKGFSFYPDALAVGALFGFLTAITFAILPLGIARETPPTSLFRSDGYDLGVRPRASYLIALAVLVMLLATLAIFISENRYVSSVFVGAIAFSFVLLRLVAMGIQWLAARAPKMKSTEWRMAIANIHRRGSLTPSVVLSLGLGLALLVALAMIDGNLRNQVSGNLPDDAPDFFFVDIQNNEIDSFRGKLDELVPAGKVIAVPLLRGRVTALKGIAAEDYKAEAGQWVLRGDRGVTYARNVPENSTLVSGEWWPDDYSGPPLVSFAEEEAVELGLVVGDMITVNILGRSISAEISSLRRVQWESLGINFVMVFSPNTFAGAPHAHLATLTIPEGSEQLLNDGSLLRAITKDFPAVTSVRVRDALDIVNTLIGQLATAIRAAASVALIASILVLGGALAAGNRARVHDAVVLKTLGATRGTLIRAFIYEYALLGLATAIFALVAGSLASWFVISQIMQFPSVFLPSVAFYTIAVALVFTVGFGLVGTWRILGQKAAPVLREL